jgi:hypothetical protein
VKHLVIYSMGIRHLLTSVSIWAMLEFEKTGQCGSFSEHDVDIRKWRGGYSEKVDARCY